MRETLLRIALQIHFSVMKLITTAGLRALAWIQYRFDKPFSIGCFTFPETKSDKTFIIKSLKISIAESNQIYLYWMFEHFSIQVGQHFKLVVSKFQQPSLTKHLEI